MTLETDISRRFRLMSFICACLIVLIHSTVFPANGGWQWWTAYVLGRDGVCRIAVPFFFLASGYFLSRHVEEIGWYGRAVLSRVKSLLVPFYIWQLVGVAVTLVVAYGIRISGYENYHGNIAIPDFSFDWMLRIIGLDPFANIGVLWYLRAVFILVLISPLLLKLKYVGAFCLLTAYFIFELFKPGDEGMFNCFEYFCPLRGLLYFSVGLLLRRADLKKLNFSIGMGALSLGILLLVAKGCFVLNNNRFAGSVDFFMVPFLLVGVWCWVGASLPRRLPFFVELSFPLYLIHGHVILFITIACATLDVSTLAKTNIGFMFLKFICGSMVSIIVARWMRQTFPKCATIVFGGRG